MTLDHVTMKDPVCGMTVDVERARADGLVVVHDGHEVVFCRQRCREDFLREPAAYLAPGAHLAPAASSHASPAGAVVIDEGMRRWYDSCSCCLGDTYPEVKAALDAERAAAGAASAGPGVCEVAETEALQTQP